MSYYLPRIVGLSVAADWMLTGRAVPAEEAFQRGLVSELVDDGHLIDHAIERASQIAERQAKQALALQVNADASDLAAAVELENRNQVITHATQEAADARERWAR